MKILWQVFASLVWTAASGVNHNGDPRIAHDLVDIAASAGADAVKFQKFEARTLVRRDTPLAAYQTGATSQFELLSRLELEDSVFLDLASHAAESGIEFLCTPFSIEAARFLVDEVNVQAIKVASGDLTYTQMLRYLASTSKPILLSTGMADLVEISRALVDLEGSDVVLLHCTSQYPAPPRDANLTAIKALRDLTGDPVGFSDHFVEDVPSLMAVAMGVRVIERHFTFDSSADGPDHKASMDPEKLQSWVEAIRVADAALGSGAKAAQPSEADTRRVARRSLVFARDLKIGHIIAGSDLAALRPADGISPQDVDRVIGRRVLQGSRAGEIVTWDGIQ